MSSPQAPPSLLEALRTQLLQEGGAPSRRKLTLLIEAGAARVDGRVARDPAAPVPTGARVSFDLDDVDPTTVAAARPRARAPLPPGVLFADAQLVVIERSAFPAADGPALATEVAQHLGREALHAVHDPSAPGFGPVLLAGSEAARRALEGAISEGRVLETLLSVRTPAQAGAHELILERRATGSGRPATPFALLRREEAPLAAAPLGARQLVAPQRLALALKHPRTNRRIAFEVEASSAFLAACSRLGFAGGPGG